VDISGGGVGVSDRAEKADQQSGSAEARDPQVDRPAGLFHSLSTGQGPLLWTSLWLLGSLAWLSQDHVLRDGDEEGHVGAAELFAQLLHEGRWVDFFGGALWGDYGEYPPLYAAWVGMGWWASGVADPGSLGLRALGLLPFLLAAALIARAAAQRSPEPAAAARAAGLAALLLPLGNGLARHFMPEGLVVLAVAALILALVHAQRRPGWAAALGLGLVLGLGLLVKQTVGLYALPILALAALALGGRIVGSLGVAALVAGPWYAGHLADQAAYAEASVAGAAAGLGAQLAYYPLVMGLEVGGPPLCLLAAGALLGRRGQASTRALRRLGLVVLLGGGLILTLVPKKYPRLLAPLSPALALLIATAPGRRMEALLLGGGGLWLIGASLLPLPQPDLLRAVDPRCPQDWIRPPIDDDLGVGAIIEALRPLPTGELVVIGGPEIPCAVQTTHPWIDHLPAVLRRAGLDGWSVRPSEAPSGDWVIDWRCGLDGDVPVAPLQGGFCQGPHNAL
jgi:4-amino-4-deoxy-L-arabinose transferase-like glycosyltransferase